MKLNPQPVKGGGKPSITHRRVLCTHYGDCLDLAVQMRWDGFTCSECRAYRSFTQCPELWLEDAMACRALLRVMGCS